MKNIHTKDAHGAQHKWESEWKDHSLSILSSTVRDNFPKVDATSLTVGTLIKFSEINKVKDTDGNEIIHLVGLTSEISVVSLKLAYVLSGLDITSKQFLWDLAGYFTDVKPEEEQKNHKMLLPPVMVTFNDGGVLNFRLVNVTSEKEVIPKTETVRADVPYSNLTLNSFKEQLDNLENE